MIKNFSLENLVQHIRDSQKQYNALHNTLHPDGRHPEEGVHPGDRKDIEEDLEQAGQILDSYFSVLLKLVENYIKPEKIVIFKDEAAWCAHRNNFTNIQESLCAFGDTPAEALENLESNKEII